MRSSKNSKYLAYSANKDLAIVMVILKTERGILQKKKHNTGARSGVRQGCDCS